MLIIFDCDGVLVDSEALAAEIFSRCLAEEGISLLPEDCYRQFHGQSLARCFRWIEEAYKRTLPPNFEKKLEQRTQQAFAEKLRPVKGVELILDGLTRASIPFCVASNGSHKKIENSLRMTGLLSYFPSARYSVEDVSSGKPSPELFLHAAESVGVPENFCWVIEDSLAGIEAGLNAGMKVFALIEQGHLSISSNSLHCFSSLEDIFEELKERIPLQ